MLITTAPVASTSKFPQPILGAGDHLELSVIPPPPRIPTVISGSVVKRDGALLQLDPEEDLPTSGKKALDPSHKTSLGHALANLNSARLEHDAWSAERLEYVADFIDHNRQIINGGLISNLIPIPYQVIDGPASFDAFLWLCGMSKGKGEQGIPLIRAANGARTLVGSTLQAQYHSLSQALASVRAAMTTSQGYQSTQKAVTTALAGSQILIAKCRHCDERSFASKQKDWKHPCSVATAKMGHLTAMQVRLEQITQQIGTPILITPDSFQSAKLTAWKAPNGKPWQPIRTDPRFQSLKQKAERKAKAMSLSPRIYGELDRAYPKVIWEVVLVRGMLIG